MQVQAPSIPLSGRKSVVRDVVNVTDKKVILSLAALRRSEPYLTNRSSDILRGILSDIELSIQTDVIESVKLSFIISAIRSAPEDKSSHGLYLKNIISSSGYSRSTFFRVFGSNFTFRAECYSLACSYAASAIKRKLGSEERTVEDFAAYASHAIYSTYHFLLRPLHQKLQEANDGSVKSTLDMPHLLSITIMDCINKNKPTQGLQISAKEIRILIRAVEVEILENQSDCSGVNYLEDCQSIIKAFYGVIRANDPAFFADTYMI